MKQTDKILKALRKPMWEFPKEEKENTCMKPTAQCYINNHLIDTSGSSEIESCCATCMNQVNMKPKKKHECYDGCWDQHCPECGEAGHYRNCENSYEQGFKDGADTTAEQAKEIHAVEKREAYEEGMADAYGEELVHKAYEAGKAEGRREREGEIVGIVESVEITATKRHAYDTAPGRAKIANDWLMPEVKRNILEAIKTTNHKD